MTKKITTTKAEERFQKKLLPDKHGHNITVLWTDEKTNYGGDDIRDNFKLKCSKCLGTRIGPWYNRYVTNADGTIGQAFVTSANAHISQVQADLDRTPVSTEAKLIMSIEMRRGDDNEYWVAHDDDTDFFEAINRNRSGYKNPQFPWVYCHKNSRGKWNTWSHFSSRDVAIGKIMEDRLKWRNKGLVVTVHEESNTGVVPVAATVAISVRKLINDYKEAKIDKQNPIALKAWVDKSQEAVDQLNLLTDLRNEVMEAYTEALSL